MSHGETGSGKSKVKEAWEARALLDKYGLTLEQVDALLGAATLPESDSTTTITMDPDPNWSPPEEVAEAPVKDEEPDVPPRDCLGWITHETPAVYLVSKNVTLSLRPSRPNAEPPMDQMWVNHYGKGAWEVMPFSLKGRTHEEEHRNKVMYSEWGKFCITRDLAEQCFCKTWPLPTEAVISPDEYRGWNRQISRAIGKYRPLVTPDPLREVVRRVLMRVANTFINVRFHQEYGYPEWDPRIANPYKNTLGTLTLRGVPLETL